jgi:hypothetical protein
MNAILDTLPLWTAVLPLGLYLLFIGVLHLRRRPLVMSGAWDGVLLAAGLTGLAMVGPLALLRPALGGSMWGWLIVLLAFGLAVAVCMLVARPRLVVYNISIDQLRPLVAEVVSSLDPTARWAGETAALPARGLQVQIEGNGGLRTATIIAAGERASSEHWAEFGRRLRRAASRLPVRSHAVGAALAAMGGLMIVLAAWGAYRSAIAAAAPPGRANDVGARRFVGA